VEKFLLNLKMDKIFVKTVFTSGEAALKSLEKNIYGEKFYHLGPKRDNDLFKGFEKNKRSLEESDFILCTGFFEDKEDSLDFYKDLLKKHIIGITCHNSKKLIKKAVNNKANYIALGAFFTTKTKRVKYKASIKILNWSKKTTNIPIVAIGGIKLNNYKKLLLNKANFLAISSYIWNNKKYKPIEAIRKLK